MHSSLWLIAAIFTPIVVSLVSLAVPSLAPRMRTLGIVTAAVQLGFSLALWPLYGMHSGFDFVSRHSLARSWGLSFDVGVDGISLFLVILTALVTLLALLGANEEKNNAAFVRWVLLLSGATAGAFATRDLLVFFLFFELTLIPSYFLISQWGRAQARAAAMKFFVYTLFGSGFLLVGMIYLAVRHQHQVGGSLSFAYSALSHTVVSPAVATWVLVGFLIAFGVKSPLWPLHTWSPGAYSEAPTAGSMMLSALLAKLGTYGLLRFGVLILPAGVDRVRPYVMTLAVIGILYGSALAAVSKDLKRLVAYSSLAQVGFIILGLFSGSLTALNGAVLLMFNHGVITAAMFLLIGFVERRRGTSEIAALKGLQAPAPVLAGLFTLVMLGSIGLPGLNGFVSEFLILLGSFQSHPWWAAVATTGVIFAALYLLWAYQRVFHGEADEPNAAISDATRSERLVLVPLCVLIVVAGVLPSLFLKPIGASVHHVAPATSQEAGR